MIQLAAFALAALASAGAQSPSPPDVPMGAFPDYGHPEIMADNCTSNGADRTECVIPAKTAGRYLVVAAGTATATGPNAVQEIALGGPYWQCGQPVATKKVVGQVTSDLDRPMHYNRPERQAAASDRRIQGR